MKKRLLALLMALTLLLCASCGLSRSKEEKLIRKAWESIDATHTPDGIYIIRYTDRSELCDDSPDAGFYDEIPDAGYAVIIGPSVHTSGYDGLHTVFLSEKEEVLHTFDYADNYALYRVSTSSTVRSGSQPEKAAGYLEECDYFAFMYNYALGDSESTRGEALCKQQNVWYSLTEKQIKNLTQ